MQPIIAISLGFPIEEMKSLYGRMADLRELAPNLIFYKNHLEVTHGNKKTFILPTRIFERVVYFSRNDDQNRSAVNIEELIITTFARFQYITRIDIHMESAKFTAICM